MSCLFTFVASAIGQNKVQSLYERARPYLQCMEARAADIPVSAASSSANRHPEPGAVVLLGLNALAGPFCEMALRHGKQIVVVDGDVGVIEHLSKKRQHFTLLQNGTTHQHTTVVGNLTTRMTTPDDLMRAAVALVVASQHSKHCGDVVHQRTW